jgi:asparagine synthase (glutamine-hydrolysing)
MCGIAGILGAERAASARVAEALAKALAHRGPDDHGVETLPVGSEGRSLTLVHRRLSIIDLSPLGHQPMFDPTTGNWIVYNGEIFNFRELRREREAGGDRFRSGSDTEVILKLYAAYGRNVLDRLCGMFALALWDESRRELLLAVDPVGIKPLYHCRAEDGSFLFASEVRALLASGVVSRSLDPVAVESYLSYGAVQAPNSIVRGVTSLHGGTYLRVQADGVVSVPKRYWSPGFAPAAAPSVEGAAVLPRLRELLRLVVRQHMVSDVPIGVFLSGGIDSSSIVALMHEVAPGAVNTFSVAFAEQEYSEAPYARAIADRYSDKHHEICLSGSDLLATLPSALAALDQPTIDGINVYVIARAVREAGMKVVLSGQGGDELFAGYPTFKLVPSAVRWRRVARLLPRSGWQLSAALWSVKSRRRAIPSKLSQFLAGAGDVFSTFLLLRQLFPPATRQMLFPSRPTRGMVHGLPEGFAGELINDLAPLDPVNQVSLLELRTYLANMLLRDGDVMSMAHGLEVRLPLLDRRLVEMVAGIPGQTKVDRRRPKPWLLGAMGSALPRMIYDRPKQGFTFPWEVWLRSCLRPELEACLGSKLLCESIGLDWHACQHLWRAFLGRRPGLTWSRIWGVFVLLDWCRRHGVRLR